MSFQFGPRRGIHINIVDELKAGVVTLSKDEIAKFEAFDLIYRSLCALLYNYVPTSGHPGGSISSGRFVASLILDSMDYDFSNPDRLDADIISYGAGHKALGLYAMWALRNEIMRVGAPDLLPSDTKLQLRLEDLLGFRRNPVTTTPLFKKFHSKSLDGHPTPATPFIKLSTGASGVGVAASLGLAFGAIDYFGRENSPRINIVEGEGGMTPGRVAEAMAAAGTSSLGNVVLHVDWNQASIDSNHVCRDGMTPGDYVQWTPAELAYLNDWNVIEVADGKDFAQVVAAQRRARMITNGQPTAIVYRTIKGWQYGIEGRSSHGAGHKMCADGFYKAVETMIAKYNLELPKCENSARCNAGGDRVLAEECFWNALGVVRKAVEKEPALAKELANRVRGSRDRLVALKRKPRDGAPDVAAIYDAAKKISEKIPDELVLKIGSQTTLRGELGKTLNYLNRMGRGAILCAAADLAGSTNINEISKGFGDGFFNAVTNGDARLLSMGGICEDAMSGVLAGLSTFGHHIGAGSSYGAFLAPLGHIAARLHAIGMQGRQEIAKGPMSPFILICAHAGLKTGEDGPTHADPQCLQLFEENFPKGSMITLTPWDPQEVAVLMGRALALRPAVIAPFVTRPNEKVLDRAALGLSSHLDAKQGLYCLRRAKGKGDGVLVLQESGVTYAFLEGALPQLIREGIDLNIYYVASAELFGMLTSDEQERIFPESHAKIAMGITGFTISTMQRWIRSDLGRAHSMHPFQKGRFLGSGQADQVLLEAGLDGESQLNGIKRYLAALKGKI